MPDSIESIQRLIREHHQRLTLAGRVRAVIEDSSDLPANKVRIYRLDIRRLQIVNGFKYEPGLYCWVELMPDQEYQVVDTDIPSSTQVFGEGVGARTIPPGAQETVAWSIPDLGLVPGRLEASSLGGLYVHSREFDYDGGRHLGGNFDGAGNFDATAYDESVAAYVPAATGYTVWVRRYFDKADATFHFAAGAEEYWPSVSYLSEASIEAIPIPAGTYPVGAVALAYGQTTVVGGRFASSRYLLGKKEIEISQIVIDGRGFVVTDGQGRVVYGSR